MSSIFDIPEDGATYSADTVSPKEDSAHALEAYAKDLARLQALAKTVKESLEEATDALLSALPPANKEVGETLLIAGKYNIHISTGERWSWDQQLLAEVLNADPVLPSCAKMKVAIDKKRFEEADAPVRAALLTALTRTPSKPKIKIEAN